MLFLKKQGFTLIELMVVIVIIGVLASLAIPRFTEASVKAKCVDGPRTIALWESSFGACMAETGKSEECKPESGGMIFKNTSKWWKSVEGTSEGKDVFTVTAEGISTSVDGTELTSMYTDEDGFVRSSKPGTDEKAHDKYFGGFGTKTE